MNFHLLHPAFLLATILAFNASAAVHCVDLKSTNPTSPYASWSTAATNIQDAVDAAGSGDLVLVTNGIYCSGGAVVFGSLSNRVAVTKAVIVESVNGPTVTAIEGFRNALTPSGDDAVRGVYLTNGAALIGFTVTNGATRSEGDETEEQCGGGVFCEGVTAIVSNCVIRGNAAFSGGAGMFQGTSIHCTFLDNSAPVGVGGGAFFSVLNNCVLSGNTATYGGGAYGSTLKNCTVVLNRALNEGGGTFGGALTNCIVYFNISPASPNFVAGTVSSSCTSPLASPENISNDPLFVDLPGGDLRLQSNSFCINMGDNTAVTENVDSSGSSRVIGGAVDIGAYEYQSPMPMRIAIDPEYTSLTPGFAAIFHGYYQKGVPTTTSWDFGDGTTISNNLYLLHSWSTAGQYTVTLRAFNTNYPAGVSAVVTINVSTQQSYYVSVASTNPVSPYLSWATAATNIQDAVDAALPVTNSVILVSDGVYRSGGRIVHGFMSNRVAILKPIQLRSVNGPDKTVIEGNQVPGTTNGDSAVRCVYMARTALLSGFTLTNGATRILGNEVAERCGGGVFSEYYGGIVTNCILVGNAADNTGGGAFYATLDHCRLINNSAITGMGGGAGGCVLISCLLTGNSAVGGGGANACSLYNCTVTGNSASTIGGGIWGSLANNSILYYNAAPSGSNYTDTFYTASYLSFSCTAPTPSSQYSGIGNITNAPLFVDQIHGDFHVKSDSPCINTADNNVAVIGNTDLDGEPRVVDGTIDIGAYEFQSPVPLVTTIRTDFTNSLPGFATPFESQVIGGIPTSTFWDFGDGTIVSNTPFLTHAWTSPGDYTVVFHAYSTTHPEGTTTSIAVHVPAHLFYHVDVNGTNPLAPYDSWATAATNIQDAVDTAVASPGSIVLVSDGIYQSGGRIFYGALSNRVMITKRIVVQSVNGPKSTVIRGYQVPGTTNGDAAVRCVYLTDGASLIGFTLTNGATRTLGDNTDQECCGGAILCNGNSVVVSNCVLTGNAAWGGGGAALEGTYYNCAFTDNATFLANSGGGAANSAILNNCIVVGNSGPAGGGAYNCLLRNCTVTSNTASVDAGGTWIGTAYNSIIYGNLSSGSNPNYLGSSLASCWIVDPLFVDVPSRNFRLQSNSPCINIGNSSFVGTTTDLDGNPRVFDGEVDIGAYEFQTAVPLAVTMKPDYTNSIPGYNLSFTATIKQGFPSATVWDFGDGVVVSNTLALTHSWNSVGTYLVTFSAFRGTNPPVSASVLVYVASQSPYFVDLGCTNPIPPYSSWSTAATNLQDAVAAALPISSSLVLATNGVYQSGARVVNGSMSNRLAITKPVRVQSVNGARMTVIRGYQVSGGGGDSAVRCVYLGNGALLSGFTLTNGATRTVGNVNDEQCGGGVRCQSLSAVVSNCIIIGNVANAGGAGALLGTLKNCTLSGNVSPTGAGGAANSSVLINCLVIGNSSSFGGGTYAGILTNCSLSANSASTAGGGSYGGTLYNSIVYYNNSPASPNYFGSTFRSCCTTPLPGGPNNFTNAPKFVDPVGNDLHLSSTSPCINAGNNTYTAGAIDLDGNPRIIAATVDLGAYEFQLPSSTISYAWLQQYGLPTDGSADFSDNDGDQMNNWQEWRAGTSPVDPSSLLRMLTVTNDSSGTTVYWQSVNSVTYYLQRSDLSNQSGFSTVRSNIVGQAGVTSFRDTTATGSGPFFYRAGVQ